jgi:hypothetical protein
MVNLKQSSLTFVEDLLAYVLHFHKKELISGQNFDIVVQNG